MWQRELPQGARPVGYRKLVETYALKTLPHFCWSYISPKWEKREILSEDEQTLLRLYPPSLSVPDTVFHHIEFALKHENVNLFIVKKVLQNLSIETITEYVSSKPAGKYARIVWYLYEQWFEKKLPLPDRQKGSYVPLLDPKKYYCGQPQRSSRHRVANNLLGNLTFSPIVRKTPLLADLEAKQLDKQVQTLTQKYDNATLARAMHYLYTKETISSWEIEREKPDKSRLATFVSLHHKADSIGPLTEAVFVSLQKEIVDPRFALDSYRTFQNYVGEEPRMGQTIVHYIAPRPHDVPLLMEGLVDTFTNMYRSSLHPIVIAAVLSFGFVFIHPFEDGNGRIHRFLIHYALSRCQFSPPGILFPVSAVMVRDLWSYDKILERISRPLLDLITDYSINDIGEMQVQQETKKFYQYLDFTPFVEFLFQCVEKTLLTDFREELEFLAQYDKIKQECKEIVDMPDQKMDLLIKCIRQNGGTLSTRKQQRYFPMLTEEEIKNLEKVIDRK